MPAAASVPTPMPMSVPTELACPACLGDLDPCDERRPIPSLECPRCNRVKAIGLFHRDSTRPDGRSAWCGECRNEHRRLPGGRGPYRRAVLEAAA